MRTIRRTATEEEMEAWRGRCAARRALYDAKEEATQKHLEANGFDALFDQADAAEEEEYRLLELIMATEAETMAGAVAKMRFSAIQAGGINPGSDAENMSTTERLIVAALADLERIAGAAA